MKTRLLRVCLVKIGNAEMGREPDMGIEMIVFFVIKSLD